MGTHVKTVSIVFCTLLVCGGATASAVTLLSGKNIKKNSIPFNRLTKSTQKKLNKVSAQSVVPGPQGAKGDKGANGAGGGKGDKGDKGDTGSVAYSGSHWGLIDRNVIGSPVGALRSGPYEGTGAGSAPPLGVGSLGVSVGNVPASTEKVAFGNEVDFAGDKVTSITAVGFSVFWTGEDKGFFADNLPNITFEVDRNGGTLGAGEYSSLVFVADGSPGGTDLPTNRFNAIDATSTDAGSWYFTNNSAGTGCVQATMCSFTALKAAVAANSPDMSVLTLAVAKGRDYAFNGAIDALRYNGSIFDFEPFGVFTTAAP